LLSFLPFAFFTDKILAQCISRKTVVNPGDANMSIKKSEKMKGLTKIVNPFIFSGRDGRI